MVGHVPFNLAPTVSNFLKRSVNKGNCGSDRVASQSRGRLWRGKTVQVQAVWSRGIHRQAQEDYKR